MGYLVKCVHCDYINYKDTEPVRCPFCGSITAKLELPFKGESFVFKVPDMRDRIVDSTVTFEEAANIIESIVNEELQKVIQDNFTRYRVIFMIQAYGWLMLKKHPQLWLDIKTFIVGIVEILTLKIEGPKNAI